jgi:hypothetical protein
MQQLSGIHRPTTSTLLKSSCTLLSITTPKTRQFLLSFLFLFFLVLRPLDECETPTCVSVEFFSLVHTFSVAKAETASVCIPLRIERQCVWLLEHPGSCVCVCVCVCACVRAYVCAHACVHPTY